MKDRLILILLLFSVSLSAQDIGGQYYVAHPDSSYSGMSTASDSNNGSYANPWASLAHAFSTVDKFDTTYIREGHWMMTDQLFYTPVDSSWNEGRPDSLIYYLNYPDEEVTLDFANVITGDGISQYWKQGLHLDRCNFIYFRGFDVINVLQDHDYGTVHGINGYGCSNLTFENVNVKYIGGKGFNFIGDFQNVEFPEQLAWEYDTLLFKNCDASYCMDSLVLQAGAEADIGNYSDGFWINNTDSLNYIHFQNCRAWMNSDDGYDIPSSGGIIFDGCWCFNNGHLLDGAGQGFRFATNATTAHGEIFRCISACNKTMGLVEGVMQEHFDTYVYNNFFYKNKQWGLDVTSREGATAINIYRNNINYANHADWEGYQAGITTGSSIYAHSHNTWLSGSTYNISDLPDIDPAISLSDADFVSLDTLQLWGDRVDGELPTITFGHLAEGSDMIDVGSADTLFVQLGMSYNGTAPDLGAFESGTFYRFGKSGTGVVLIGADGKPLKYE